MLSMYVCNNMHFYKSQKKATWYDILSTVYDRERIKLIIYREWPLIAIYIAINEWKYEVTLIYLFQN